MGHKQQIGQAHAVTDAIQTRRASDQSLQALEGCRLEAEPQGAQGRFGQGDVLAHLQRQKAGLQTASDRADHAPHLLALHRVSRKQPLPLGRETLLERFKRHQRVGPDLFAHLQHRHLCQWVERHKPGFALLLVIERNRPVAKAQLLEPQGDLQPVAATGAPAAIESDGVGVHGRREQRG